MIITQGTIETIVVDVTDLTGEVTDLGLSGARYSVLDANDEYKYENELVSSIDDMRLFCLIDTTDPTLWDAGLYRLYVKFTQAPETPKLGPFRFGVVV